MKDFVFTENINFLIKISYNFSLKQNLKQNY